MPRYEIRNQSGRVVNAIIVPEDKIGDFLGVDQTAHLMSSLDRPIAEYRQRALDRLTEAMKEIRNGIVTDLPGQQMIYLRKEEQARALVAAVTGGQIPVPADYPLLAAEVGLTAQTIYQVAQVILFKSTLWQRIAAALEAYRFTKQAEIATATEKEITAYVDIDHKAALRAAIAGL